MVEPHGMQRGSRRAAAALALLALFAGAEPQAAAAEGPMTLERMDAVIREHGAQVLRRDGIWEFDFFGVRMACVTDAKHNRMRLISPVIELNKVTPEQHLKLLEANFHTALDARYGASEGILYALFLHPLGSLGDDQLRSALLQVAALARSFGGDYSSGTLRYGEPGTTM